MIVRGRLFMSGNTSKTNLEEYAMRHSMAHILASAIFRLYPNTQFGIGPVVDNGFYYDFLIPGVSLSDGDLPKIETVMRAIIKENLRFEQYNMAINDALSWAEQSKQVFKKELINDLKREGTTLFKDLNHDELGIFVDHNKTQLKEVSFYKDGEFIDLCRGPHIASTGLAGSFKLMRISGAYWRGKESNPQLQRIYGVAFMNDQNLKEYLAQIEEAKNRDHRKLGQELDLFIFSDLVGSGLPLFTPRGTILRDELANFSNQLRLEIGFEKVFVPHLTKTDLYVKSGHMAKFGDELFLVKSQETKDKLVLKPMNCPHHTRIYAFRQRSYKELPIRYLETTTVYRDEKSGELGGLNRVRAITQDDSHIFCSQEQINYEINNLLKLTQKFYKVIGMELRLRLSFRDDSPQYLGSPEIWRTSEEQLKSAVEKNKLDFFIEKGEAAFYGPKIDFMATDSLKREHQVATIQLDFVQPERFELTYDASDGSKQQPVMIHAAILGSIERFMAVYIEHTGGKFPLWLSPEQLRIITLNQEDGVVEFARKFEIMAKKRGLRVKLDNGNESVSKKIREVERLKIPYSVVIGAKELKLGLVTPRIRSDLYDGLTSNTSFKIETFIESLVYERDNRLARTHIK